mmetsp:Transcript_17186/g.17403  ORF Transcript_17186/g.17403 Transcript_17186/m.17403 type:complete len:81 (-) Transcript_17186:166-408(-)
MRERNVSVKDTSHDVPSNEDTNDVLGIDSAAALDDSAAPCDDVVRDDVTSCNHSAQKILPQISSLYFFEEKSEMTLDGQP